MDRSWINLLKIEDVLHFDKYTLKSGLCLIVVINLDTINRSTNFQIVQDQLRLHAISFATTV